MYLCPVFGVALYNHNSVKGCTTDIFIKYLVGNGEGDFLFSAGTDITAFFSSFTGVLAFFVDLTGVVSFFNDFGVVLGT